MGTNYALMVALCGLVGVCMGIMWALYRRLRFLERVVAGWREAEVTELKDARKGLSDLTDTQITLMGRVRVLSEELQRETGTRKRSLKWMHYRLHRLREKLDNL